MWWRSWFFERGKFIMKQYLNHSTWIWHFNDQLRENFGLPATELYCIWRVHSRSDNRNQHHRFTMQTSHFCNQLKTSIYRKNPESGFQIHERLVQKTELAKAASLANRIGNRKEWQRIARTAALFTQNILMRIFRFCRFNEITSWSVRSVHLVITW